jgi:hypothetical protein
MRSSVLNCISVELHWRPVANGRDRALGIRSTRVPVGTYYVGGPNLGFRCQLCADLARSFFAAFGSTARTNYDLLFLFPRHDCGDQENDKAAYGQIGIRYWGISTPRGLRPRGLLKFPNLGATKTNLGVSQCSHPIFHMQAPDAECRKKIKITCPPCALASARFKNKPKLELCNCFCRNFEK